MKKLIAFLLVSILLVVLCVCVTACNNPSPIEDIETSLVRLLDAAGHENITVYDASELTAEILENRRGTMVVERCIGMITDAEQGDGVILNACDEGYYISYREVSWPLSKGTVVLSYMVYNPNNEYIDDIIERYDFILDIEWGRLEEICMSSAM